MTKTNKIGVRIDGYLQSGRVTDGDGRQYRVSHAETQDIEDERISFEVSESKKGQLWAVRVMPRL